MAACTPASAACEVMAEAREAAVHLLALLREDHGKRQLAEKIICCIDRARAAMCGAGAGSNGRPTKQGLAARPPTGSKRRARGCEEARARTVSSTMDDGYAWRKYGEKSIQDHRNPRFYFRCAYRDELRCGARKQVERMEDDPSLFHVAYFVEHTPACPCRDDSRRVVPPTTSLGSFFRPCSPAEGTANMVEFAAEYCWPVEDQLADLVSSGISFAFPGQLESLDASLEGLMGLL